MTNYSQDEPIATLFDILEEGREYAFHGGDPVLEPTLINMALKNLSQIYKYKDYIQAWKCLPAVDKTWPNFKQIFTEAAVEIESEAKAFKNPYHANQLQQEQALYATAQELANLTAASNA